MGFGDRREAPCRFIVYLKADNLRPNFIINIYIELNDFAKEFGNFSRKDVCIYTLLKYHTDIAVSMINNKTI